MIGQLKAKDKDRRLPRPLLLVYLLLTGCSGAGGSTQSFGDTPPIPHDAVIITRDTAVRPAALGEHTLLLSWRMRLAGGMMCSGSAPLTEYRKAFGPHIVPA
jgi:hypothetical protein